MPFLDYDKEHFVVSGKQLSMGVGFIVSKRDSRLFSKGRQAKNCYMKSVLIGNVDWSLACFWTSEPVTCTGFLPTPSPLTLTEAQRLDSSSTRKMPSTAFLRMCTVVHQFRDCYFK